MTSSKHPVLSGDVRGAEDVVAHGLELLWSCTQRLAQFAHSDQTGLAVASIAALGKIGDVRALESLVTLLEDDQLAEEAVMALSRLEHPSVAQRLLDLIGTSVPKVTSACAAVLWRFKDERVVEKLAPLVKAPYAEVRRAAVASLGLLGLKGSVEPLFEALKDSDEEIVIATLKSLRTLEVRSSDQLIPQLSSLYESIDNPKIRATIVQAFSDIGDSDMLSLAKRALKDSNPRVRANAVELIGAMTLPDKLKAIILKPLIQEGEHNRVLGNVAIALAKVEPATSMSLLSKLLNSVQKWERASAVYAARFVQNERVSSWLTTQFTSEADPDVLRNIIESLAYYSSAEVTACFIRALTHENALIRLGAAKSLGRIKDETAEGHLLTLLEHETDASVISEVLGALGKLADTRTIATIGRFLQHPDLRVQANAIDALSAIGTVEVIPLLEPFINSSDNRVKANAAVALWKGGSLSVVDTLEGMLDNPNVKQRSSAVYAIGEIGESLRNLHDIQKYLLLVSSLQEDMRRNTAAPMELPGRGAVSGGAPTAFPGTPHGATAPTQPPASQPGPAAATPGSAPPAGTHVDARLPVALVETVLDLIASGRKDEAVAKVEAARATDPSNPFILYLLADLFRRRDQLGAACDAFDLLHQGDTRFVNSHLLEATLHGKANEVLPSLSSYFQALRVQAKIFTEQVDLGLALIKDKRTAEASMLLKSLVGQFPIDSKMHLKAGKEFLRHGRTAAGLDHVGRAYLVSPHDPEVLLKLCLVLVDVGRLDEAETVARRLGTAAAGSQEIQDRVVKLLGLIASRRGTPQ